MTPDDELDILNTVDLLKHAGLNACVIWPHEEVLSVTPEQVLVYDPTTNTIINKL